MTGRIIRYSEYADAPARKSALVSAIDSGQAVIALLATGASIDNLGYIVKRFSFDAGTDLSNTGMYPVMLALNCNLGQFDVDKGPTQENLAENMLLAPSRGVIGWIGRPDSRATFRTAPSSRKPSIGCSTKVSLSWGISVSPPDAHSLTMAHRGHRDTYDQMSVLGDPGLDIDLGSVTDQQVDFQNGMEMTDPVPYQNRVYSGRAGLDSTKAGVVKKGQLEGRRAYRIEGYDRTVLSPTTYWLLNDDLGIVLGAASRFLTYRIKAAQHPEGVGRFGVNCVVDGAPLSGSGIKDQYGTRIAPIYRSAPLGQEMLYAFDLQSQYGKTVSKILAGYDAASDASTGYFKATIDDIRLTATWGLPPEVGSVQMPSIVYTNQTADVSVSATDPDTFMRGDSLSVEWVVAHGYVTGTGFDVVYHAPDYVVYNVEMKARIFDKGGHVDSSMKYFSVTNYTPPGCPHLTVWNGQRFVDEGAVLTLSRIDSTRQSVFDAIPFRTKPDRPGRLLRFGLREDGNDVTSLEKVTLSLVTLDSSGTDPIGVTPDGHVMRAVDSIQPYQCLDQEEFNQVDKVRAPDGDVYRAYGSGSVTLWYDFPRHSGILSAGSGDDGGAGLMMLPLPKEANKIVAAPEGSGVPNVVTVSAWLRDSGWIEVARPAPRSKAVVPQLVDLSRYGDPSQGLSIQIEWTQSFSADDLCLYRFTRAGITEVQPVLSKATHARRGDVLSLIGTEDGRRATIEPGDEIVLEFNLGQDRTYDLGVMTFWGKYRPAATPADGGNTTSPGAKNSVFLGQNVPNPFNAATRIGVFLPSEGKVTLTIHNVLGQQVAILTDGVLVGGGHEFTWEGKDGQDRAVPTGVYFYTLRFDDVVASKKMVVVK